MIAEWQKVGVNPTPDLVTTSGSGLDPDISPLDAQVQIPMVAKARHLSQAVLRTLVSEHTNSAQLGFLGASYVNVLELNVALAALAASHH
jgi:K+-transporting ATPase ATPase C chain